MRISGMCNKRNRINNTLKCIASIVLAVLLVMNQSMLVFAAEGSEAENRSLSTAAQQKETVELSDTEESVAADKAGEDKEESSSENAEEEDPARETEEGSSQKSNESDVRSALQNVDKEQKKSENDLKLNAENDTEEEMITVRVSVENYTYPVSQGAPWDGVLFDVEVTVPASYSMMQALHKACRDNDIDSWGTDGTYVIMIGGLKEFQGGGGAGWMGTLNDWFTNRGFDQISLHDGDYIAIEYTCDLGEDIGSSYNNKDKRVKALTTSTGELSPDFDMDFDSYNLMIPEDTETVSVFTTAVNRNYLVKSIVNGKEYERGAKIPVKDGTRITVKCGDPKWPSMNSYEQADSEPARTYTITVMKGAYDFLVDTTGTRCSIELERDTCMYCAGEEVKVTLSYDKERYQIVEDSVKAYVGGSKKYITPDKTAEDIYVFTMPCNDVEFKAECETKYDYPLSLTGDLIDCSMTADHTDGIYYRGEKVTFTLTAPDGKRINDLTVRACEKESGEEIELEHVSQDTYSFEMPGGHIIVYAESEKIEKNGLKSYTITTDYGVVTEELKDTSRTSICTLPERAIEYDLSLDIDGAEELIAVRAKDIYGNITAYTETEIKGIGIGTRNTALLGKELTVTVLTKDSSNRTHTYTIRVRTLKSSFYRENPDALILLESVDLNNMTLPYRKTLMTSGVTLYEVDYPTIVRDNAAQLATTAFSIFPTYEEELGSLEIRCKYATFLYSSDKRGYRSGWVRTKVGETLEVPIEIDFTLPSGEIVTRKYLYRITNGRYAKQKFRVLSSKGKPFTPAGFTLDGEQVNINGLTFEDGAFSLDVQPGDHTALSMKKMVDFTVEDDLNRPIQTDIIDIQTDVPEYDVTITCSDKSALYTIKEANTGIVYYMKSEESVFSLPPGKYTLRTTNESSHLYSRMTFTVNNGDIRITASRPGWLDPEYVVHELNMLEEIQTFDAGNGKMKVYIPDYQTEGIVAYPVIVSNPDNMKMDPAEYNPYYGDLFKGYFFTRDLKAHSLEIKYVVFNSKDGDEYSHPDTYESDVMELYMPPYDEYSEDELVMPADVRTLSIGFAQEDGSVIGSYFFRFYNHIDVIEKNAGITTEQMMAAGYRVKYTMRYKKTEDEEFKNVWLKEVPPSGAFFRTDNDHECEVLEVANISGNGLLWIDPDISDYGYIDACVNGWFEITAWFEDYNGNKSRPATITVYKDGRPPEDVVVSADRTECVYDEEQTDPIYTNKPVTLSVSAVDIGAGLHQKPYSYDHGESWVAQDTLVLTTETVIDLDDIWVRDKYGFVSRVLGPGVDREITGDPVVGQRYNFQDGWWFMTSPLWWDGTKQKKYFYIDMEAPSVNVVSTYDDQNKELTLKVKASDRISGLAEKAYSFDGGETWQSDGTHIVTLGEYRADQIVVRDKAGNQSIYDESFVWTEEVMQNDLPKIKDVKIEYGHGGNTGRDGRKWYQSATLTIEAEEGGYEFSGYSFDGVLYEKADHKLFNTSIKIPAGTITVIDIAGNTAVYDKEIDLTNLDSDPPKIDSYSFEGEAGHAVREIYTKMSASDILSGNLEYAITAVPLNEYIRNYPAEDLMIEWSDSLDDDQFLIGNVGRKYNREWLRKGAVYSAKNDYNLHHDSWYWGVRLWVRDAAGNVAFKNVCVQGEFVDQEGPSISEVTTEYKRFNDASGIVKVYVAATEPKFGIGLAKKAYSFDGGKTWQASNSISIPIGASIPAGQIMVRDMFGNISVYNKVVKTTLQDVIKRINDLDPGTAKNRDYKEIIDLYNQLSDREKSKVYNWQDFLDMLGNRKDQDWDDDFGDIGEPDDGEQGEDPQDPDDPGDDEEGEGDDDGSDGGGAGDDDGKPTDGSGSGKGGGTPEARDADGGNDTDTVSVALSNTSTSKTPDVKSKAGQNYREAEIERKGSGGMLSQGMVKLWELMLLLLIVLGAYIYGAQKRYRRFKEEAGR